MNLAGHLDVRWLGRMEFARALALQEELAVKKREDASFDDQLLLLEHDPVYTIGRTPDRSSLSARGRIRGGELGRTVAAATGRTRNTIFIVSFFRTI